MLAPNIEITMTQNTLCVPFHPLRAGAGVLLVLSLPEKVPLFQAFILFGKSIIFETQLFRDCVFKTIEIPRVPSTSEFQKFVKVWKV